MSSAPQVAAGWFQDPNDASQWRWWDGTQWTSNVAPMQSAQQAVTVAELPTAVALVPTATTQQVSAATTTPSSDVWAQPRYLVHQKMMTIGTRYELLLPTSATVNSDKTEPGRAVAFVQRKRMSIKENISFRDAQDQVLFEIGAKALNVTARYDIRTPDGTPFAHLKKKVLGSMWRTCWQVLDTSEREILIAQETSSLHAFMRRFGSMLPFGFIAEMLPYNFTITAGSGTAAPGQVLGSYRRIHGLRDRYDLDMRADTGMTVDRRNVLALAIALDVLQNR